METATIEVIPELVRKQLRLLLDQDELKRSPILAKFLDYVVTAKLEGREDEIKDYTIGVKALGRPPAFNPQIDAVVRIHAGRLRRTLIQYYYGPGKDDLIIVTIPKGTYANTPDVETVSVDALWITDESQPDALVYGMLKALFNPANRPAIQAERLGVHFLDIAPAAKDGNAPLHPGAVRFFTEAGVLKPAQKAAEPAKTPTRKS